MQINSVYLYPNKIDAFTNSLASWQTERYRRVYNRNLKIYRSVDNRVDLQVRNSDQKAADTTNSTLVFNIVTRETKDLILQKDCTTVSASTGKAYVTITAEELENLESGFYNYTVVQEIRESINDTEYLVTSRTPLYIDSQYGVISTMEIAGDVLGEAADSLVVNKFEYVNPATTGYQDPDFYISSIIDADPQRSTVNSLHTFQFYYDNYEGTVVIQGSIDEGGTPYVWTDLDTILINDTGTSYSNVNGKWNFLRVKHTPAENNAGTLDKILYR